MPSSKCYSRGNTEWDKGVQQSLTGVSTSSSSALRLHRLQRRSELASAQTSRNPGPESGETASMAVHRIVGATEAAKLIFLVQCVGPPEVTNNVRQQTSVSQFVEGLNRRKRSKQRTYVTDASVEICDLQESSVYSATSCSIHPPRLRHAPRACPSNERLATKNAKRHKMKQVAKRAENVAFHSGAFLCFLWPILAYSGVPRCASRPRALLLNRFAVEPPGLCIGCLTDRA